MRTPFWLVPFTTMAVTAPAAAHGNGPPHPHGLAAAWSLDPVVIAGLTISLVLYASGVRRLWRRAGPGRSVRRVNVTAFALGWTAVVTAIVSPLDTLADALFSAHMVQHLVLMLVAAPLLAMAAPLRAALWAFPLRTRRRLALAWVAAPRFRSAVHRVVRPGFAFLLMTMSLWIWHVPLLYDAAVRNEFLHGLEHASFLGGSLLFWWTLLNPRHRHRPDYGTAVMLSFLASMQSALLGALLTFARRPWYSAHLETAPAWGYTPLQDQELAGLIMWVPASAVYLAAIAAFAFAWLRVAERRTRPPASAPRLSPAAPRLGPTPIGSSDA
jgi:putative membrane protein